MNSRKLTGLSQMALSIGVLAAFTQPEPTRVVILPALHGAHQLNKQYTYDSLWALIEKFNPDIIGVEIRPEDLDQDSTYLLNLYPYEMRAVRTLFPGKTLVGVDYYGEEFRDKPIPLKAFQNNATELGKFKSFERRTNVDPLILKRKEEMGIDSLANWQMSMVLSSTANQLMAGPLDQLMKEYYQRLDALYKGTRYDWYLQFTTRRDIYISRNIVETIRKYPSKKILFLIGTSHRYRAVEQVKKLPQVTLIEKL